MTITVKALEWSHFDNGNAYAGSIITTYFAHMDGTWCHRNGDFIQAGRNLEDAKAGAQADYDLRILSALSVQPAAAVVGEPVGEQWRVLEDGSPRTSWYPIGDSYEKDWRELANRYPEKYQIETRHLFAQRAEDWQGFESAPKDGTVIMAWHTVHSCPMAVVWKEPGHPFNGEVLNWYEKSYTTAWPERCFSHWQPLPAPPALGGSHE